MAKSLYVPWRDTEPLEVREIESFDDFRTVLDGYPEAVDIIDLGITIYVDGEGLVKRLPFNSRLSFLWWHHIPAARSSMLVGDALITGLPDADGAATEISASTLALLMNPQEYQLMIELNDPVRRIAPDSKLAQVLLPMASGEPRRMLSMASFENYFSAIAWASIIKDGSRDVAEVKIVPHN